MSRMDGGLALAVLAAALEWLCWILSFGGGVRNW